ncbi:unnamed protein product [Hermetia illucens]|uniref:Uncharacterized protein n=1 Tax=Hermetia illucens TaxID=343691 RepID=A0A7R8YSC8_HERIL|nr:unnamed protein product [Hermetia illucens]
MSLESSFPVPASLSSRGNNAFPEIITAIYLDVKHTCTRMGIDAFHSENSIDTDFPSEKSTSGKNKVESGCMLVACRSISYRTLFLDSIGQLWRNMFSRMPSPSESDSFGTTTDQTDRLGVSAGSDSISTDSSVKDYVTTDDWWSNAIEEDTFDSPLAFDASENGLWNGRFVPPPPRPPFLDESVASDGLTTCDLCTWAWQRNAYSLDGSIGKL